uniref:Uncharacterized protein n=1 Tax=Oryza sativa subsp. japonica TaxID=39947 RepID=Q9FW94_ORYSJ|nr:hypothetical protein [Oryza sativa Japonica Group]
MRWAAARGGRPAVGANGGARRGGGDGGEVGAGVHRGEAGRRGAGRQHLEDNSVRPRRRWSRRSTSGAGREEGGEEARERAEEGGDRRGSGEAGRVVGVIPQPPPSSSFEPLPPEYDEPSHTRCCDDHLWPDDDRRAPLPFPDTCSLGFGAAAERSAARLLPLGALAASPLRALAGIPARLDSLPSAVPSSRRLELRRARWGGRDGRRAPRTLKMTTASSGVRADLPTARERGVRGGHFVALATSPPSAATGGHGAITPATPRPPPAPAPPHPAAPATALAARPRAAAAAHCPLTHA